MFLHQGTLRHTHSAANSEYLSDCGWLSSCFKKLLSPCESCSLVPLISLFLQSASREINTSEGHRGHVQSAFPSFEEGTSWLRRRCSRNPIVLGTWGVIISSMAPLPIECSGLSNLCILISLPLQIQS